MISHTEEDEEDHKEDEEGGGAGGKGRRGRGGGCERSPESNALARVSVCSLEIAEIHIC